MAEERPEPQNNNAVPPRIKLNNANGPQAKPPPGPTEPSGPEQTPVPPKIKISPKPSESKTDTTRVDLAQAKPPSAAPPPSPETVKKSTVKIEPAEPARVLSEAERMEAMKKATVRVQIEPEKGKRGTAPLQPAVGPDVEAAKKKTARIDLQEVLGGEEDIFKRRTAMLDVSKFPGVTEAPGVPKTIRIKRPEGAPPTGPVPSAAEAAPAAEAVAAEARKRETARIELPAEVSAEAPTRRKTIRIKRPEGAVPSRPAVVAAPGVPAARPPGERRAPEVEEVASPVFSVLALAAVLVACVLIYVLAAQIGTLESLDPPRWPYFGGI